LIGVKSQKNAETTVKTANPSLEIIEVIHIWTDFGHFGSCELCSRIGLTYSRIPQRQGPDLQLATFRSISLAWLLAQVAAFSLTVIFNSEGHFPKMDMALFALGVGIAALVGFGIGVVAYVALHAIARVTRGIQKSEYLGPWQLVIMAMVSIIGGTFSLATLNAVFQDANAFLFVLMGILSTFVFTRSVTAGQRTAA
jgi:ABC-type polysaccharide/polyol phosphate export permease